MKLLTKTSLNFISASVLFFLVGSIVMYFSVRSIIADDLDSRLLQQQNEFILAANHIGVETLASDLVFVKKVKVASLHTFSDTALVVNDKYVLYRKLTFTYQEQKQYHRVDILLSQSESDLLIMKISMMNVGFALFFFLVVFFVNRQSIKSALSVFYSTIRKLEKVDVSKVQELNLETAEVDEVKKLNEVVEKMSQQIHKDYESLKEYTENVSHELQTPLAIISSKTDELMQGENLTQQQMEHLALMLETTNRLSKINQSLIFLTKIDNRFYTEGSTFLLNDLIKDKLQLFESVIKEKEIELKLNLLDVTHIYMNPYLAETLIVNLIKNAIVHNVKGGVLSVSLANKTLSISNSGDAPSFPEKDIFKRFTRNEASKKSLGIGLSIVHRICELYSFDINYTYKQQHHFTIQFKS